MVNTLLVVSRPQLVKASAVPPVGRSCVKLVPTVTPLKVGARLPSGAPEKVELTGSVRSWYLVSAAQNRS